MCFLAVSYSDLAFWKFKSCCKKASPWKTNFGLLTYCFLFRVCHHTHQYLLSANCPQLRSEVSGCLRSTSPGGINLKVIYDLIYIYISGICPSLIDSVTSIRGITRKLCPTILSMSLLWALSVFNRKHLWLHPKKPSTGHHSKAYFQDVPHVTTSDVSSLWRPWNKQWSLEANTSDAYSFIQSRPISHHFWLRHPGLGQSDASDTLSDSSILAEAINLGF